MRVYIVDLCGTEERWNEPTQMHTGTLTLFGWTSVQMRVLVDSAGVPVWGVDIPPQDSSNLQSSSPVGSNGFHPCYQIGSILPSLLHFLTMCFIFRLGGPLDCLCSALRWLEMSLLSLAEVSEVSSLPAKGNRPFGFTSC